MKIVLFIALGLSYVFAFDNTDEFINEINNKQRLWKAGRNFHEDTPVSKFRSMLGFRKLPKNILDTVPIMKHVIDDSTDVPESFDSRTQWSKCKTVSEVADQSACGSCWVSFNSAQFHF